MAGEFRDRFVRRLTPATDENASLEFKTVLIMAINRFAAPATNFAAALISSPSMRQRADG